MSVDPGDPECFQRRFSSEGRRFVLAEGPFRPLVSAPLPAGFPQFDVHANVPNFGRALCAERAPTRGGSLSGLPFRPIRGPVVSFFQRKKGL